MSWETPFLIIIAGATASGKSEQAMELAEHIGGEIICADSIQLFRDLNLLTARPQKPDLQRVVHHLYGECDPLEQPTVSWWITQAKVVIADVLKRNKWPILVGGTGMYIENLIDGLSPIPQILPQIRREIEDKYADYEPLALATELAKVSPLDAEQFIDRQRMLRALMVHRQTGSGLVQHWSLGRTGKYSQKWLGFVIDCPREELRRRCADRFDEMIRQGAVEQVAELMRHLPLQWEDKQTWNRGVLRAIGASDIGAALLGKVSMQQASTNAKTATRRYAKRQQTWFRSRHGTSLQLISSADTGAIKNYLHEYNH